MSTKIEVKPHPRTVFYDEHAIRLPISLVCSQVFINLAVQITRNNLSDLPNYNEMVAEATLGGLNFASLIFLLIGFSALFHQARTEGRPAHYWAAKAKMSNPDHRPNLVDETENLRLYNMILRPGA